MIRFVYFMLKLHNLGFGHPRLLRMDIFRQRGEDRPQVEQLMLHAQENRAELRDPRIFRSGNRRQPEN